MSLDDFRERYVRAAERHSYSPIKFILFERKLLTTRNLHREDANFLANIGLPDGDPFFHFHVYSADSLEERLCFLRDPPGLYLLGEAGVSSFVAIDTRSGQIVETSYGKEELTFVNSSLAMLAETLCLFRERITSAAFLQELERIDAVAAAPGAAWRELSNDLKALGGT